MVIVVYCLLNWEKRGAANMVQLPAHVPYLIRPLNAQSVTAGKTSRGYVRYLTVQRGYQKSTSFASRTSSHSPILCFAHIIFASLLCKPLDGTEISIGFIIAGTKAATNRIDMPNDDLITDDFVAEMLAKEAADHSLKYSSMGMDGSRADKK